MELILLVFALVLFVVAAAGIPQEGVTRYRLGWAGLACYMLAILLGRGSL